MENPTIHFNSHIQQKLQQNQADQSVASAEILLVVRQALPRLAGCGTVQSAALAPTRTTGGGGVPIRGPAPAPQGPWRQGSRGPNQRKTSAEQPLPLGGRPTPPCDSEPGPPEAPGIRTPFTAGCSRQPVLFPPIQQRRPRRELHLSVISRTALK